MSEEQQYQYVLNYLFEAKMGTEQHEILFEYATEYYRLKWLKPSLG